MFLKIFILQAQLLRVLYDDVFHGFRSSPSKQVAPAIFTYAKDMSNLKVAREEGITRFWLKDISSIHSGTCVCVFFWVGGLPIALICKTNLSTWRFDGSKFQCFPPMKFDLWIYSPVANELFFICFVFVR